MQNNKTIIENVKELNNFIEFRQIKKLLKTINNMKNTNIERQLCDPFDLLASSQINGNFKLIKCSYIVSICRKNHGNVNVHFWRTFTGLCMTVENSNIICKHWKRFI